jgi:hypothetical protein
MNFEKYINTLPCPEKPKRAQTLRQNPKFKPLTSFTDARVLAEALEQDEADQKVYTEALAKWKEEEMRLRSSFKHDLYEELCILGNPKADILFAKAASMSSDGSYPEIMYRAYELVELIL